jgi:hypothetical protein
VRASSGNQLFLFDEGRNSQLNVSEEAMNKIVLSVLFVLMLAGESRVQADPWPHTGTYGLGTRNIYVYNTLSRDLYVYFESATAPKYLHFKIKSGKDTLIELPNQWSSGQCYATYDTLYKKPFVTLAEWTLGAAGAGYADFYDISLVDAFSVPMLLGPIEGTFTKRSNLPADQVKYDCGTAVCTTNVLLQCPQLQQWKNGAGDLVACLGSCQTAARGRVADSLRSWYCCEKPHDIPSTCPPNPISTWFKQLNPDAYSYAYDDQKSTYVCVPPANHIGPDYNLVFGSRMPVAVDTRYNTDAPYRDRQPKVFCRKDNRLEYDLSGFATPPVTMTLFSCNGSSLGSFLLAQQKGVLPLAPAHAGLYAVRVQKGQSVFAQRVLWAWPMK